jgi:hypothetical protein
MSKLLNDGRIKISVSSEDLSNNMSSNVFNQLTKLQEFAKNKATGNTQNEVKLNSNKKR